jgi:GDP-D-mannose 3',5'-epimerase
MKTALVCGAGGFIGGHLVDRLKMEGFWVRAVDLVANEYNPLAADNFVIGDLRDPVVVRSVVDRDFDEVYQLAADMGGAGYLFTGDNDAEIMHNSATINLNILNTCTKQNTGRLFYSSSACVYPQSNQMDPSAPNCAEESTYPADPDSEYGWEKLFSERLYLAYSRNKSMQCRIGRYHNIFGPKGTWKGGKEKVPAALCRKAALAEDGNEIEVWGDGLQTRSFLYIDDAIDATLRLTRSDFSGPVNIGSEEMISINELAKMAIELSGKDIAIKNIPGPEGVRGRCSDNRVIERELGWTPAWALRESMRDTFSWISHEIAKARSLAA